jgi:hypothetical protein
MKKNLLWMFAAILFCGMITTSCSKDDDNNNNNPQTPDTPQEETMLDVELNFIAHPKSLQYFEYDFKYVDANGNTKTIDIDQNTESASLGILAEQPIYTGVVDVIASVDGYTDLKNPFVYRVTLKNQPVGKTISYTTTCHVKENATITETLVYATPGVLALKTAYMSAFVPFSMRTWKITPDKWEQYISSLEGTTIGQATDEFTVE